MLAEAQICMPFVYDINECGFIENTACLVRPVFWYVALCGGCCQYRPIVGLPVLAIRSDLVNRHTIIWFE